MMQIKNNDGDVLTRNIKYASPLLIMSNKVVNRLIDGTSHIQVIGEPTKYFDLEIRSTKAQAEIISLMVANGDMIHFEFGEVEYNGYILEDVDWQLIGSPSADWYVASVRLIVVEVINSA